MAWVQSRTNKLKRYLFVYLLVLPGTLDMLIFRYVPMHGVLIAFKDYSIRRGIWGSKWNGFENFGRLFVEPQFINVVRNTLTINFFNITLGFTFIIILALMIHELRIRTLRRTIQTLVYLPHFISWVVFAGLVMTFLATDDEAPLNVIVSFFGGKPRSWVTNRSLFRGIVVVTGIIKDAGFGTVIYLAALSSVNMEMVESSLIDGANRLQVIWYIYLPRIAPTIVVLFILHLANLFSSNFDQVFNLYNPAVYEKGDVISTYLYRTGLLQGNFESATALGLLFNVLGLILVLLASAVIKRLNVMGIFS